MARLVQRSRPLQVELKSGGEKFVTGGVTDVAPYWQATTGRYHRVTGADLLWVAVGGTYTRPRLVVHIACRSLDPHHPHHRGLRLYRPEVGERCGKCWPPSQIIG